MADTNPHVTTSGVFDITNTQNRILKKGNPPPTLSGDRKTNAGLLVAYVRDNSSDLLRKDFSHTIGNMRVDHQPGTPGTNNSAIQNNITPRKNSESFSSVQAPDELFGQGGFGIAMALAHEESLRTKMIFTISLNGERAARAAAPPPAARPTKWTCSQCNHADNALPTTYSSGKLMCNGCFQWLDPKV